MQYWMSHNNAKCTKYRYFSGVFGKVALIYTPKFCVVCYDTFKTKPNISLSKCQNAELSPPSSGAESLIKVICEDLNVGRTVIFKVKLLMESGANVKQK